jgi:DNA topoisomerase-2
LPVADEPQDSSVNHIDVHHVGDAPPTGRTPTIEERYSRKTPLEHILLRPGMYVGPTERLPATKHWVVDTPPLPPSPSILSVTPSDFSDPSSPQTAHLESAVRASPSLRLVLREISYIPALLKVFDEILVNAADQRLRHPRECTRLDVTIDPGCAGSRRPPLIRVTNNGPSIPIQIHKGENLYVPDLLFGHLLTGSNFDDSERRVTGGRHGYGAKLANIFSAWFQVETAHFQAGQCLMYQQAWSNNMRQSTGPIVRSLSPDERREIEGDYTCISFVPDTTRLSGRAFISAEGAEVQEATISPDDYALMCRRVLDVAGCNAASSPLSSSIPSLRVILNGIDVTQKSFADYCQLYRSQVTAERDDPNSLKDGSKPAESSRNSICFHAITDRWIVGVGKSEAGSLEAISFVNGMSTPRGGTHVNALLSQVCKRVAERAAKLDPEIASMVSPALVRRHLFLCVNALIENPSFDSQMKECLTSSPSSFGSSCELPDKFLDGHVLLPADKGGPGIVEEVIRAARGRQQATLLQQLGTSGKKTKRQLMSMIPKLEDAHLAGTEAGWDCTLILTEGDSAKALAVAGLEEIGRDRFGVFPLRGKFLNVRHATVSQLATNGEIRALCAIVGLEFDKEYATTEERRELRYGHIMLMTDQDTGTKPITRIHARLVRRLRSRFS